MALSVGLKECRQRHGDSGIDPAVLERRAILSGWKGFCHVASGVAEGCFQSMNGKVRLVGGSQRLPKSPRYHCVSMNMILVFVPSAELAWSISPPT